MDPGVCQMMTDLSDVPSGVRQYAEDGEIVECDSPESQGSDCNEVKDIDEVMMQITEEKKEEKFGEPQYGDGAVIHNESFDDERNGNLEVQPVPGTPISEKKSDSQNPIWWREIERAKEQCLQCPE
eukprot:Selendium_serpulae@DN10520_c0_g1_i1.p1